MRKAKKQVKRFVISILPLTQDGTKILREFGWFNSSSKNHKTFRFSEAQVFEDQGTGHGTPDEWIELLSEDHPNWKLGFVYIDNKTTKDNKKKHEEQD